MNWPFGKRGRNRSLSQSLQTLRGQAPAAGTRTDHPRHDAWGFHQYALLFPKGADGIASDFYGFVTVKGHVACLKGRIVHDVTISFRPFFQKVDGVFQARYLSDEFPAFLQIDGLIKYLRVHLYLTENVGDQQGWRRNRAPAGNVFSNFFGFKIGRGRKVEFFQRRPHDPHRSSHASINGLFVNKKAGGRTKTAEYKAWQQLAGTFIVIMECPHCRIGPCSRKASIVGLDIEPQRAALDEAPRSLRAIARPPLDAAPMTAVSLQARAPFLPLIASVFQ